MTDNEIVGAINPFTWTKTAGFKNWVAPKEGETPFISTWDWYHETANASHAKDRVANELGLKVEMLKLAIEDVLGLHSDFKIYGECECAERGEEGHLLSDPEWSEFAFCAKSFMYLICLECCTDGEDTEMTEECADYHDHGEGKPICKTHQVIHNRLGGE